MSFVTDKSIGTTAAPQSRVLIGLLVLILFLVLGLAWQAIRTMQAHQDTATGVLQDYARLVTDEFARRSMGEVGYYGYYTYINAMRRRALESAGFPFDVLPADGDTAVARASRLASYRFFVDASIGKLHAAGASVPEPAIEQYLRERATAILGLPLPEAGFIVEHARIGGDPRTFLVSTVDNTEHVFGFEVDRDELSLWLQQAFDKAPLLPESVAEGIVTNRFIYLRFVDGAGQVLFESRQDHDPYLVVSKPLGDDYEGIFSGHIVSAAIDPAIAGSLVIGGLPRSRLPVLAGVIVLTVALLIAAIRQLRREHALMALRTNFVSEVSHELRTPLTQIRMFTETLLFERFKSRDDRLRALNIINRESQRLIHLVENVLRFSGQQAPRELCRIDSELAPLVDRVVDEFAPLAKSTDATVATDLDRQASAPIDPDALSQVLLNLLDNAVKYGPVGQCIKVTLAQRPETVLIGVEDQGPGIPPADRDRIWEGYYRLDRERRSAKSGTGIGLSVVRDLVRRHGGKVRVQDGVDGGARFVVEFPKTVSQRTTA